MGKKKIFLVLGLGIFGTTIAEGLNKYGHDVIAIDKDMTRVEKLSDIVNQCACLDFTDIDELSSVGIEDVDAAVVATGDDLQSAILTVLNLKEMNIPNVIVKANNRTAAKVLRKIGADKVITPEVDIAKVTAKKLSFQYVVDLFDIDGSNSIMEIHMNENWVGKSLVDLDLRREYEINVIGVRRNGIMIVNVDPNDPLQEDDQLLVVASDRNKLIQQIPEKE